jgi:hypothetical protein
LMRWYCQRCYQLMACADTHWYYITYAAAADYADILLAAIIRHYGCRHSATPLIICH